MTNKPTPQDVTFSAAQLEYLMKHFPVLTFGHTATEAHLRHYHGQQSVLLFIQERTRRG